MDRIIAVQSAQRFQFAFGYGLFVGDDRGAFQDRTREFALFDRIQNGRNKIFIFRIAGKLQFFIELQKTNAPVFRVAVLQIFCGVLDFLFADPEFFGNV